MLPRASGLFPSLFRFLFTTITSGDNFFGSAALESDLRSACEDSRPRLPISAIGFQTLLPPTPPTLIVSPPPSEGLNLNCKISGRGFRGLTLVKFGSLFGDCRLFSRFLIYFA